MKHIIMCGGTYRKWEVPRQLLKVNGETIIERTIRLLREQGINDIAISSNHPAFRAFGVPVLEHDNSYDANGLSDISGQWCDAFYPTEEPVCYLFGDVIFSPEAIRTITETETDDIEFFASAPPFSEDYIKPWAEPFALKVTDTDHLKRAVIRVKELDAAGCFHRKPIMWELWQVIKGTPINWIDYTNYTVINDYTCDIDNEEDISLIETW